MHCKVCKNNLLENAWGMKGFCSRNCFALFVGKKNEGRIMTEEHKEKTVKSRRANLGKGSCTYCQKEFDKYNKNQTTCRDKKCIAKNTRDNYEREKYTNPFRAKAKRITGSIKLKGKRNIIEQMLQNSVGKPCDYCKEIITLENASLDHKIPRKFSKVYDRKLKQRIYDLDVIRKLDNPSNLHIVCNKCNQIKSDMNDEQFKTFMTMLKDRPDIKELVFKRLNWARNNWSRWKK